MAMIQGLVDHPTKTLHNKWALKKRLQHEYKLATAKSEVALKNARDSRLVPKAMKKTRDPKRELSLKGKS